MLDAVPSSVSPIHPAWFAVTRYGEALIVLPAMVATLWMSRHAGVRPLAERWALLLALAAALTTVTKLAFIGWGLGIAALDFTGISGHAMFAAATWPLLTRLAFAPGRGGLASRVAWSAGGVIAAAVAVSRVVIGAHSVSEIVFGAALGASVSVGALRRGRPNEVAASRRLPIVLTLWFAAYLPWFGMALPKLDTHGLVTKLAVTLAGRETPFTRADLHRAR